MKSWLRLQINGFVLLVLHVMVSSSCSVLKELKIKSRNSIVCITLWPLLPLVTYSKIVSTFLSCEPEVSYSGKF